MRLLALVSGGKDSILSILLSQSVYGHEVVGLLNVQPKQDFASQHNNNNGGDVDSHCFQTVGHQLLDGIAQCMNLPLFRTSIGPNQSINQNLVYCEVVDSSNNDNHQGDGDNDEIEILFQLVKSTCEKFAAQGTPIGGLCSGAILSSYQRLRVERICQRLKLASYSFLWQRAALNVLRLVEHFNLKALLIKVASYGLKPSFLGKSLVVMTPTLAKLHREGMCHAAGEGGEYESVVIGCPSLFAKSHKKLVIREESKKIVGDDVRCGSGEGTLIFDVDVVDDDENDNINDAPLRDSSGFFDLSGFCGYVSVDDARSFLSRFVSTEEVNFLTKTALRNMKQKLLEKIINPEEKSAFKLSLRKEASSNVPEKEVGQQAKQILLSNCLLDENTNNNNNNNNNNKSDCESSKSKIIYTLVYGSEFSYFGDVNNAYLDVFAKTVPPPSRAFVGCGSDAKLKISVISLDEKYFNNNNNNNSKNILSRSTLHVQSISNWAAACIGPYAQSQTITCSCEKCLEATENSNDNNNKSKIILTSGTIGLEPPTMVLTGSATSRHPLSVDAVSAQENSEEILLFQESLMSIANVHAILQKSGCPSGGHGLDLLTHGTIFFAKKRLRKLIQEEKEFDDAESRAMTIFGAAWKVFAKRIFDDTEEKVKRHNKLFANSSSTSENDDDDDGENEHSNNDGSNSKNNTIDDCDRQTEIIRIAPTLIDEKTKTFVHEEIRVVFVETLPRDAAVEFIAGVSFSGSSFSPSCETKLTTIAMSKFFAATAQAN